jgi:hypothetical protein
MKFNQHFIISIVKYLILFWNEYFWHEKINLEVQNIEKTFRSLTTSFKTVIIALSVLFKTKWIRLFFATFLQIASAQITNDCLLL